MFGRQGTAGKKPARGVGVHLMLLLGDLMDAIRQRCAKWDILSDRAPGNGVGPVFLVRQFPENAHFIVKTLQGYLGHKKSRAPTSVGPRFLKLRKREQKPVGPRFLQLRKRTKAVGPRFLKFKKTDKCGRSVFVTGPVRVHVLY